MPTVKLLAPPGSANRQLQTASGNYTVGPDNTVTVDSREVSALLAAGYSEFDDDFAAGMRMLGGSHTVSAADDTAGFVAIATGLSSIDSFSVMILRSNVLTSSANISKAGGTITVADNAALYLLMAGDVIFWMAMGS